MLRLSHVIKLATPAVLVMALYCSATAGLAHALDQTTELEFIGEATFATGYRYDETEVGGLSGLDFNLDTGRYIAISDDRGRRGYPRFYELEIDVADGELRDGDVRFTGVTEIKNTNGNSFEDGDVDPEAIRYAPSHDLVYWTSEGSARDGVPPSVRAMTPAGIHEREFRLPGKYLPRPNFGVRNNLALESLTLGPEPGQIVVATENALTQDDGRPSLNRGTRVRVLTLDIVHATPVAEHIYTTEPIPEAPEPADGFSSNGLAELLRLNSNQMIAVERAYSAGKGNTIRLFMTTFSGATDVLEKESLTDATFQIMPKRLLLDLTTLGIKLDNIEGASFGPEVDGDRTLVLVSDNNFNSKNQLTQFLGFRIKTN